MTISTINRKFGLALMAGALVVSAFAPLSALADGEYGGSDYYGGSYDYGTTDYYGGGYDSGATDYYGGSYDYGTTDYYGGGYDSGTTDYYGGGYDSTTADYGSSYTTPSYSAPSFGGSSYSSMPSFGGSSYSQPIYTSAANQQYRQYIAPQLPQFVQPNVANACTAVNSCNSDNSYHYTDNSVYAPDNSYTNTVTDNSVYSAPTTVTVTAPTTVTTDSHNQQITYPQPTYQAPVFQQPQYQSQYQYQYQAQYQQPTYQPTCYTNCYQPRPVAYNTTPYITLSQAPYTGLDLGPVGEVLYWSFLVLWCLAAAYLIVVKRVQNKLVSFLNGFLFGSSTKTVVHTTHAPQAHAVASAPMVEEGIDPFIQSQIKRA